jgi:hypothetical protein
MNKKEMKYIKKNQKLKWRERSNEKSINKNSFFITFHSLTTIT